MVEIYIIFNRTVVRSCHVVSMNCKMFSPQVHSVNQNVILPFPVYVSINIEHNNVLCKVIGPYHCTITENKM
jgi:hypothetical protein